MYEIAILALDGVVPFDLSTPCEVFGRVRVPGLAEPYRIKVCGETEYIHAGAFDLRVQYDLSYLAGAHAVIVPGLADIGQPVSQAVINALRTAAANRTRIASICTGAFVLAATGMLDGLRATTHWLAAPELARRYPGIKVDPNVLFVDNGQLLTSAGAAAGLDLCLHLVRRDYGGAAAADAARLSVMPLEREGGQAQFIIYEPPTSGTTLEPLLRWLEENLHRILTLEEIAAQARLSVRTLNRRFREQTGTSPLQWVQAARVRRARQLLETTGLSIEQVSSAVGFESATTFRERFNRLVGTSPQAYRRSFGYRPLTRAVPS
jgi:transcriptional regulator GlxA family with amidase domain